MPSPLRYNSDSMGTWRDLCDRTKLATYWVTSLVTILATLLASSGTSRFFQKFVEKLTNFTLYQACGFFSGSFRRVYKKNRADLTAKSQSCFSQRLVSIVLTSD
ncbi:hypothetical protein TNCV_5065441 [Trichonephila clavipes]|nr:hypothetical protein TNCV_5065441 [Trichonephila clavipes]